MAVREGDSVLFMDVAHAQVDRPIPMHVQAVLFGLIASEKKKKTQNLEGDTGDDWENLIS